MNPTFPENIFKKQKYKILQKHRIVGYVFKNISFFATCPWQPWPDWLTDWPAAGASCPPWGSGARRGRRTWPAATAAPAWRAGPPRSSQQSRTPLGAFQGCPSQVFQSQTILQTIRSLKKWQKSLLWKTQLKHLMERSFERSFYKENIVWKIFL